MREPAVRQARAGDVAPLSMWNLFVTKGGLRVVVFYGVLRGLFLLRANRDVREPAASKRCKQFVLADPTDARSLLAVDTGALVIAPTDLADDGLSKTVPASRLVRMDLCAPGGCRSGLASSRRDESSNANQGGTCSDDGAKSCESQVRDAVTWAIATRVEPSVVLVAPNAVLDRVAEAETGSTSSRTLTACRLL